MAMASVGARVHLAGSIHKEQVRRCADIEKLRCHSGSLSARVKPDRHYIDI